MAIQETVFNSPTVDTISDWLDNNCSQFFESCESSNGRVSIMFTSSTTTNYVSLDISSSDSSVTLINTNGITANFDGSNSKIDPIKGIVTDYGFGLIGKTGINVLVSKTNTDNPCVIMCGINNSYWSIKCADIGGDCNIIDLIPSSSFSYNNNYITTDAKPSLVYKCDKTVLAPIVYDCGSYSPNLLISKFTQSTDFSYRKIKVNNIEFAYDGVFALRG